MQYMYGNVLNIYCFHIQETPSLRNLFSFERKGWLNLVWDWSRGILDYYKSSIMIISGEGGMVSCGHFAQISQSPRNKNKIFFFPSALEFLMRHPEVEIFPPKYPPNSYVLLQRTWFWLVSVKVTRVNGQGPGPGLQFWCPTAETGKRNEISLRGAS